MNTPDQPAPEPNRGLVEKDRADAREVLGEVAEWRLSPERWAQVEVVLGTLQAAAAAGDPAAYHDAVVALEESAPKRTDRLGKGPKTPPPDEAEKRVNQLVHDLDGGAAGSGSSSGGDGRGRKSGDGGSSGR